ncbi:hypothetical protein C8J57DRAFT_1537707 [Mycena rebaudengoi]|nr:hypothetical protein C8J57DRAFT_1537707 [Mycena rebaudengoi]
MAQNTDPESNTSSANSQELQVLLSRVATLVQMSLDMAKVAVDVQHRLPIVLAHHVDEALAGIPQLVAEQVAVEVAAKTAVAVAAVAGDNPSPVAEFVRGIAITPSALELLHPAGNGDDLAWHVVLVGREPGIYQSVATSDELTNGVPKYMRRRKSSHLEALSYYRINYEAQKVEKWVEPMPATVAGPSTTV